MLLNLINSMNNKTNNKLTPKQIDEMCEVYKKHIYTLTEIGDMFGVVASSVHGVVKRRNLIPLNKINRTYTIDVNAFSEINSASSYYLGFLYADGYVNKTRNTVVLSLQYNDKHILDEFSRFLKTNKPIQYIKQGKRIGRDKHHWALSIESKKIKDDLIDLGCIPMKTKILKFPNIGVEFIPDFIRGYFDGDGCITYSVENKLWSFSVWGTKSVLSGIKSYLETNIGVNNEVSIIHTKSEGVFSLRYSAKKDVFNIGKMLYQNNTCHKLIRKYNKYLEIFKSYDQT